MVVTDLQTRKVEIAGITCEPCEAWMMHVARNLTDAVEGALVGKRVMVMDRGSSTAAFRSMLEGVGVRPVRLPARSPNLNALVERFVLSIKSECLASARWGRRICAGRSRNVSSTTTPSGLTRGSGGLDRAGRWDGWSCGRGALQG